MMILMTLGLGVYIAYEVILTISKPIKEKRICMLARYVACGMSCYYLLGSVVLWTFHQIGREIPTALRGIPYTEEAYFLRFIFGLSIALFMWPDTYYRLTEYAHRHWPVFYHKYAMASRLQLRRKHDEKHDYNS